MTKKSAKLIISKTSGNASHSSNLAFLKNKVVLVTGGTGSFGRHFVQTILKRSSVQKLIVFSRDELKQSEMAAAIKDERLRFFIGDIRDLQRLHRAFQGVDFVVHAAALKQVPILEYNPFEAVLTNVVGSQNVINAAIDRGVQKVVALSTDKAVNPINLYGATKLCAEKLFINGNVYVGVRKARFSCVRYGNVVGSRGSVVPLFIQKRAEGVLPVTDERMTRFWITLDQGVRMVLEALESMQGGEIFVPKIPSMRVTDLAKAIDPKCAVKIVGMRPGEKLHEMLLTDDEATRTVDMDHYFVVKPQFPWWGNPKWKGALPPKGFSYTSDNNGHWLRPEELKGMLNGLQQEKLPAKA